MAYNPQWDYDYKIDALDLDLGPYVALTKGQKHETSWTVVRTANQYVGLCMAQTDYDGADDEETDGATVEDREYSRDAR